MENFKEFLSRIRSFEHPIEVFNSSKDLMPSNSVRAKVENDGNFKSFYGNTTVFSLDNSTKKWLEHIISVIMLTAPNVFCQRLDTILLHTTLHDIVSGTDSQKIADDIVSTELALKNSWNSLGNSHRADERIIFRPVSIFNMVNTSLVVGLEPRDEEDYMKLMELYNSVEEVHSLPYGYTPHITLGYFNANGAPK